MFGGITLLSNRTLYERFQKAREPQRMELLFEMARRVGTSEAIFMSLFGPIFSERNLYPAVLLSRGISFYFLLAVSGVAIVVFKVVKGVRRNRMLRG